jgi:hypothetical protein
MCVIYITNKRKAVKDKNMHRIMKRRMMFNQKSLLRRRREELGFARSDIVRLIEEQGYQDRCDPQKIMFLEDRRSKPRDENFLRCLCKVLTLSIDDVARDLEIVPEKIRQAYFEGKIQYEEGL